MYDEFVFFPFCQNVDPPLFTTSFITYIKRCIDLEEQSQIYNCTNFCLNITSHQRDIDVRIMPNLQILSKWRLPSLTITQCFAYIS